VTQFPGIEGVAEGGDDSCSNRVRPEHSHCVGQVAPDYRPHAAERSSLRGSVYMHNAELGIHDVDTERSPLDQFSQQLVASVEAVMWPLAFAQRCLRRQFSCRHSLKSSDSFSKAAILYFKCELGRWHSTHHALPFGI